MKAQSSIKILLAAILALTACGTRDYETTEPPKPSPGEEIALPPPEPSQRRILLTAQKPSPGYLWGGLRWIGVPDHQLSEVMSNLADDDNTNTFAAFGVTVVGGAILGFIIRVSNSWFFGGPIESKAGHWFWNRVDRSVKTASQGIVRGAAFGAGCHLLLTGLHPIPFDGLLGEDYRALSSSLVIGGLSSITFGHMITRLAEKNWISPQSPLYYSKWGQLQEWTQTTEIGRNLRYRFLPGLIILGLGTGIGMIVFDHVHDK